MNHQKTMICYMSVFKRTKKKLLEKYSHANLTNNQNVFFKLFSKKEDNKKCSSRLLRPIGVSIVTTPAY